MKIKVVHYHALINLGQYNNEKIGFSADIDEAESVADVLNKLRELVKENASLNAEEVNQNLYSGRRELAEMQAKIDKAKAEWDAVAEFLRTQGIKPDAPNMPRFTGLLPEVKEEHVGELIDSF